MRPLFFAPLIVFVFTLLGLLDQASSSLYAQSNTLNECFETLYRNRKLINQSKVPNQQFLFPTLDPTYQKQKQTFENWEECVKGHQAPFMSFQTLNGESYEVAALAGKIIVVNFWSTSCAPCLAEMPALNKLVEEYQDKNVIFLGFTGEKVAKLTPAFFEKHTFNFKIVAEAQTIIRLLHGYELPTTYIIDQQGVIRKAWIGIGSYNEMDKLAPYYKAKSAIDELLTAAKK